jgi:hypothetical protein
MIKKFALRSIDSLVTPGLGSNIQFASTLSVSTTFIAMAMNSPMWATCVALSYDEYRITQVRISSQPLNRTSVTRSTGGFAMCLDADNTAGTPSLSAVICYGMSRHLPIDEHWEVLWNVPQNSSGVWYDVAGVVSQQVGGFFLGSDPTFSTGTSYASLAIEVTVLARGQI